jgi:alpha-amylase/alpha-mannosidase (GH57 family)
MVELAAAQPGLRLTFNVVPSLVDQLLDLGEGRTQDPALLLARRPADALGMEEQLGILDLFFSVPYRTRIAPFPRYAALFHKRGSRGGDGTYSEALGRFKAHDYRDLMVWFHLAWCGETLKRHEVVRELVRKAEGFTETEKAALLDAQQAFVRGVVPRLQRAAASDGVELSTSPYYHPILPLLCDTESAREAAPGIALPHPPFRRHADAVEQVRGAVERHREVFGAAPVGIWPSEGSLSEEVVGILDAAGIRWAAGDEGVLAASLALSGEDAARGGKPPRDRICSGFRLGDAGPVLFFRDRELSDLIGFTYSSWDGEGAAQDFVSRLLAIRDELGPRAAGAVVPVILDGENAWEHFPDGGVSFLTALYRRLTSTPGLETTTFSGYLDGPHETARLRRLRAGSWIRSDFTTWIGHPDKNRGWDLLRVARDAFDAAARDVADEARRLAFRCLLAAEGSDWFWWYGEEHTSEEDPIFDASFRDLLKEVYRLLRRPPPEALSLPIVTRRRAAYESPTGIVTPTLDGRLTDYFEWLLAGVCDAASGFGTMRPGVAPIERLAFGWGPGHVYLRVDPVGVSAREFMHRGDLTVEFALPRPRRIVVRCAPEAGAPVADPPSVRCTADRVVELAVPLAELGAADGERVAFAVVYESGSAPIERLPRDGEIELLAAPTFEWSV